MKTKSILLLQLFFGTLSLGIIQAWARPTEQSIKGFNLSTCDIKNSYCLTVKADSTTGSQFKMLHVFNHPEVILKSIDKDTKEIISADSGYIDLNENQLVLYKKDSKGKVVETAIDLISFSRSDLSYTR